MPLPQAPGGEPPVRPAPLPDASRPARGLGVALLVAAALTVMIPLGAAEAVAQPVAPAAPARIVSLNLCGDQLALALAAPGAVAALSPFARDPRLSAAQREAARYPSVATAEEALAAEADFVLVGPSDRLATRAMLAARGVPLFVVPHADTVAEARRIVADVGARLGRPDEAGAVLAGIDAAVATAAAATAARSGPAPTVLPIERRGYVSGPESLLGDMLRLAGYRHALPNLGVGGLVPLETVLTLKPDLLLVADADDRGDDQGSALLRHPALAAIPRLRLPQRLTLCPGPAIAEAIRRLSAP